MIVMITMMKVAIPSIIAEMIVDYLAINRWIKKVLQWTLGLLHRKTYGAPPPPEEN